MADLVDRRLYPGTHAGERPDSPAVVFAPSGAVTTWRELDARSNQLAHLLGRLGLRRGGHIAIISDNDPRVFEVVWAALRSGLYYTPVNTRLTTNEMTEILRSSHASVVFASGRCFQAAVEAAASAPEAVHVLCLDEPGSSGARPLDELLAEMPTDRLDDEPEGAPLWFSSGTSGRPKAVTRPLPDTPGDPLAQQYAEAFELGADTVHLCLGPLHHAAPIGFSTIVHRLGGTVILTEGFDPEEVLALVESHGVTFSHLVPTMFVRLLKLPPEVKSRYDLGSLRRVVHGAAPCPVEVKHQMIEWWGPIIDEYYAGTEGVGSTIITADEWLARPGSVGLAKRGAIHIVDEAGEELGPGRDGLVYFDNRAMTVQYLGDPEETRAITHTAGWQTLGDIGHLDEDGYLYLTDRWAHKIVRGGVNIFPREIEEVLIGHPDVLDAAVVGVPDDEMGEEVRAVVQLVDPRRAGDILAGELVEYCQRRLAKYKCPRAVDFDPSLPRQDNGKLYKRLIRDRYWAERPLRI